jgi:hypothetical protein
MKAARRASERCGVTRHAAQPDDESVPVVRIYETHDPLRGLLVRGLLESDGIRVLTTGEGSGPYRIGPVVLSVPEHEAERARELVEASDAGRLALSDDEAIVLEPSTD